MPALRLSRKLFLAFALLAGVKGFVLAHGGCGWVESREEHGSRFAITAPLEAPEP